MTQKKISELNAATTLAGTEVLPVVQSSATVKATVNQVLANLSAANLTSGTVPLARLSNITNTEISASAAIAWTKVSKTGSSLADLATRSAGDLNSGTLPLARLSNITNTEISASAAIAWTKINKSGAVLSDIDTHLTDFPNQSGNSGKYLKTDGSALSWDTPAGGGGGTIGLAEVFLLMGG